MAQRNVIWTKTADLQFVGVLEYWVNRNKSNRYSLKLLQLVKERVSQIALTPYIYKSTDYKDYRVSILDNYSIYYKITDSQITITAFWDNRQDPKKLLQILKRNNL